MKAEHLKLKYGHIIENNMIGNINDVIGVFGEPTNISRFAENIIELWFDNFKIAIYYGNYLYRYCLLVKDEEIQYDNSLIRIWET